MTPAAQAALDLAVCEDRAPARRERRPCARPRGVTIGQLLTRTHDAVQASSSADCPMCGGALERQGHDARCGDCGTRLF